jgi:hypothetical protein
MSRKAVTKVLEQAASDAAFRSRLAADPDGAFAGFDLDAAERDELRGLGPETLAALPGLAGGEGSALRRIVPTTFKEWGAAILSLLLLAIFAVLLLVWALRIGTDPRGVSIGDTTVTIDEFQRGKDIVTILLPLVGAVISFWLGVAVEGKRADENKQSAENEKDARQTAETRELRKTQTAASALLQAQGLAQELRGTAAASGGSVARGVGRGTGVDPDVSAKLDELDRTLREGQQQLLQ